MNHLFSYMPEQTQEEWQRIFLVAGTLEIGTDLSCLLYTSDAADE